MSLSAVLNEIERQNKRLERAGVGDASKHPPLAIAIYHNDLNREPIRDFATPEPVAGVREVLIVVIPSGRALADESAPPDFEALARDASAAADNGTEWPPNVLNDLVSRPLPHEAPPPAADGTDFKGGARKGGSSEPASRDAVPQGVAHEASIDVGELDERVAELVETGTDWGTAARNVLADMQAELKVPAKKGRVQ